MYWVHKLQKRKFTTSSGEVPFWQPMSKLPREMGDLSPLFQQVFGGKDVKVDEKIWSCHRFQLNETVRKELFSSAFLCPIRNGEQYPYEVDIRDIELYLYPLGAGMLVIYVDWLPNGGAKHELSLHDMRTLLNISKYRHKVAMVCNGWGFTNHTESDLSTASIPAEQKTQLGDLMYASKYRHDTVSLSSLGNWLLHLDDEDPSSPPQRCDFARHATHQTTVVIDREPPRDVLYSYLFHLRHAYGQKNRPPLDASATLGKTLVWRLNRYIGVSKEGSVSISWPIPGGEDFEVNFWHQKFLGIYLLLALHAQGEKLVLFELSDMAATQADRLKLDSEAQSLTEIKNSRNATRNLASLMVRYMLGMSSNDCGGTSEYSDFFTSLRVTFGIPELREELSNELRDVLAVVESNYLEEERRQRDEQEASRRQAYDLHKRMSQERSQQNDTFQILLSVFGSFTLPFVLVGGIWGMNLSTLPNVDFSLILGMTVLASFLILIALLLVRWYMRFRAEKVRRRPQLSAESLSLDFDHFV